MSRGSRPKQRAAYISYAVFVLTLIAIVLVFISGALLWTPQKEEQTRSIYNDTCLLYTYDVFTKRYKNPPAYPCKLSCPGVPLRGYCPEEQAIRLILYAKILEINTDDILSLALQAERAFSTIDSLYIAILTGDSSKIELFRNARIIEENIEVNMARVAEILQKFAEDGDLSTLEMISMAVEVR